MIEKINSYFREELWNFPLSREKGWRRFWIKCLRIGYLAARGFIQDKCSLSASSLTYYALMSIVPVLAMALAIARGFGYHDMLRAELLQRFPDQQITMVELFKYADTFLEQARGGVIAGVGLVLLFLAVALLLSNLESILNHIWGIKKLRSWKRILSDYFALMLIAPIFFVLASSISVFIINKIEMAIRVLPFSHWFISWLLFLVNLIPYGLFWVLFTFIYLFMPNTRVRLNSACLGGVLAGSLYVVVQWGYIYFQIGVSRYGAIYGSMAALPLFMVWIQISWFILLFGAEITHAHQTLDEHEFEGQVGRLSRNFKRLVTLWVVHLAIKKGFLTRALLVKQFQIPSGLVKPILEELVASQVLYETGGGYVPSQESQNTRISDLVLLLESRGENSLPFIDKKALEPFEKALARFRETLESSPHNIRLSHVSDPL